MRKFKDVSELTPEELEQHNKAQAEYYKVANDKEDRMMLRLFNQLGITDYQFTPQKTEWDGYFTRKIEVIYEVKCRNHKAFTFKDCSVDCYKINKLIKQSQIEGKVPYCFFFYEDDKVCWEELPSSVEEIKYEKRLNWVTKRDQFGNYYQTEALQYHIPLKKEQTINLK